MTPDTADTVFFPGAGSFGSEFQLLVDELKPTAWVVRYPGRLGRDFGVPAESFDAVVRACAEQISRRSPDRPVLFGHSFGAYVAYATALKLQADGAEIAALMVVGADAPHRLQVSALATGTPADAGRYLDQVDPGALAKAPSDDWREIVLETTVQDLRLLKQFDASAGRRLRCPILAARGDADPLTSAAGAGEWQRCTDGQFSLHSLPGGHSDFLRSGTRASLIRQIREIDQSSAPVSIQEHRP